MFCVQLPKVIYKHLVQVCYDHAETIQNILYHKFNIEVSYLLIVLDFNWFRLQKPFVEH